MIKNMRKRLNKKGLMFLFGLAFIGFIFGIIFLLIIGESDKSMVLSYLDEYKSMIQTFNIQLFKDILINNLFFIIIVWICGISIIGIPINIFYYFIKSFILGFTISSFILKYKFKGCLISLLYLIPQNIINMLLFTIITYFSINFSFVLIYSLTKKKNFNIKYKFDKYSKVLLICIVGVVITSLYEGFILPIILKKLYFF